MNPRWRMLLWEQGRTARFRDHYESSAAKKLIAILFKLCLLWCGLPACCFAWYGRPAGVGTRYESSTPYKIEFHNALVRKIARCRNMKFNFMKDYLPKHSFRQYPYLLRTSNLPCKLSILSIPSIMSRYKIKIHNTIISAFLHYQSSIVNCQLPTSIKQTSRHNCIPHLLTTFRTSPFIFNTKHLLSGKIRKVLSRGHKTNQGEPSCHTKIHNIFFQATKQIQKPQHIV